MRPSGNGSVYEIVGEGVQHWQSLTGGVGSEDEMNGESPVGRTVSSVL
jgi:hypothetical protein